MSEIEKLIERAKMYIPSGASSTGDVSDRRMRLPVLFQYNQEVLFGLGQKVMLAFRLQLQ
jgi:hypothetical protein